MPRLLAIALLLVAAITPRAAHAQVDVPSLRWKTITTDHFRIHYEPQLEAWAQKLASEIESVRRAVASRVGYTPPQVIDIVVEDPLNTPNGSAWPFLVSPAMRFWATPPAPNSVLGAARGWGEILSVHEYAHLAHLLRPSRAPLAGVIAFFVGMPVSPMTMNSPAWVAEGYATLIEGELTGAGRPNGVARPAILRTLALEGYLPAYGELDNTARFNGGAMRYLVGSAYLDWLQTQRGDSALPQLWRRMTAREKRGFVPAFTGLFGEDPSVLYGRFTAELTAQATSARRTLESQGLARGTLVQHWSMNVGSPAISPNGALLAVRRLSAKGTSEIQILSFAPDSSRKPDSLSSADRAARRDSSRAAKRTAKRAAKDPEDVPAYEPYPKPLKRVATLGLSAGAAYDSPRWMPDGERLLVARLVPLADGRARPDLFIWNHKSKQVRRVTHAAGIMQADPLPDSERAAALTCGSGTCSLLMVDLRTGETSPLAEGGIDRSYAGVRVSPDGKRIATARQRGASWDLVVVDVATRATRVVGPQDGASRYSPAWENDSTLIVLSEASSVASLERIYLNGGDVSVVARTLGQAGVPDVASDGRVWWLDLHARGFDLRVSAAGAAVAPAAKLDVTDFPAVQRISQQHALVFDSVAVRPSHSYGAGPFSGTLLAATSSAPDGESWSVGANAGDLLTRLGLYVLAGGAAKGGWQGGRAAMTWRGFRPELQLQLFSAGHDPSQQQRAGGAALVGYDLRYSGGLAAVRYTRTGVRGTSTLRLGLSSGEIDPANSTPFDRSMGFASFATNAIFTPNPKSPLRTSFAMELSSGTTNNYDWQRTTAEAMIGIGGAVGLGLRGRIGQVNADAPIAEMFNVGGTASPYIDASVLSQRVEHLALPFNARSGRRMAIISAETTGPFRLYHDWIAAGASFGDTWDRVIGAEVAMRVAGLGALRLPNTSLKSGVAHGLEGLMRNATVVYLSLSFTP